MPASAWKPQQKQWRIAPRCEGLDDLARQIGATPLIAQLLLNRGITGVDHGRAFFTPKLTDLHDPSLLGGADEAARRIAHAVRNGEKIVIYGDYDVDGMTSVAILDACLKLVGAPVDYYVPHRLEEGYGVNAEAVRKIAADGCGLLVTVDCGVSAVGPLAEAKAAGMDVVVTDHHALGAELPDVVAVVHPALPGAAYPNPNLCGAGVAFKVAWQVARELCGNHRVDEPMRKFLLDATTLAALGTVADVVPLVGENRSLVTFGLRGLAATDHRGLRALLETSGLTGGKLESFDIGFKLAPRLNACGRMGHARLAVELLTDPEPARAREIAEYLSAQNTLRQKVEREVAAEAVEMVKARGFDGPDHAAIVLAADHWHGGVIGIVASRLVEQFGKPAVLISRHGDDLARGSCRSVPGFHMREALAACADCLEGFGGHEMAGGLSIRPDRLEAFAATLGAYARENLAPEAMVACLDLDAEVTMAELAYPAVDRIHRMAPFGQGNPHPVVAIRDCRVINPPRRMGKTGQTVGMVLGQGSGRLRAVGFGMGDLTEMLVGVNTVDVAAEPVLNSFNGRTSVELKLVDVAWRY